MYVGRYVGRHRLISISHSSSSLILIRTHDHYRSTSARYSGLPMRLFKKFVTSSQVQRFQLVTQWRTRSWIVHYAFNAAQNADNESRFCVFQGAKFKLDKRSDTFQPMTGATAFRLNHWIPGPEARYPLSLEAAETWSLETHPRSRSRSRSLQTSKHGHGHGHLIFIFATYPTFHNLRSPQVPMCAALRSRHWVRVTVLHVLLYALAGVLSQSSVLFLFLCTYAFQSLLICIHNHVSSLHSFHISRSRHGHGIFILAAYPEGIWTYLCVLCVLCVVVSYLHSCVSRCHGHVTVTELLAAIFNTLYFKLNGHHLCLFHKLLIRQTHSRSTFNGVRKRC